MTALPSLLTLFHLLRLAGLRLGLAETQDALRALAALDDARWVPTALKATLVKRRADEAVFDRVFELAFGPLSSPRFVPSPAAPSRGMGQEGVGGSGGGGNPDRDGADTPRQTSAMARAVQFLLRHVHPARHTPHPRTIQEAVVLLADMVQREEGGARPLEAVRAEIQHAFLAALEAEQRAPALEALLRPPDVEGLDFGRLDRSEAELAEAQVERLIQHLLARPRRRTQHDAVGRLDLRKTVRRSLQFGGTPVRLTRRRRRIEPPALYVLADISSSVEAYTRFFLMLTRAFQAQAQKCRSFVFADRLLEVTHPLARALVRTGSSGRAVDGLLARLRAEGWTTRRTDYGTTLAQFEQATQHALARKDTVVVLGDARTNGTPPRADALRAVRQRVRRVLWLNPERGVLWNTGDSVQATYAPHCHHLAECRNLAQLRQVVDALRLLGR